MKDIVKQKMSKILWRVNLKYANYRLKLQQTLAQGVFRYYGTLMVISALITIEKELLH